MSKTNTETPITPAEAGELTAARLLQGSAWATVIRADTAETKYEAGRYAIEPVRYSRWGLAIPRLADDLPWAQSNSETVDNILVNLIASDDIETATAERELRKAEDLAGWSLTVHDLRAHESDVQPEKGAEDSGGWGFYVSLDVQVGNGPREVVNLSGKQAIVTLWRCWCEGRFPVAGTFRLLGKERGGRNRPIGFDVETKLG